MVYLFVLAMTALALLFIASKIFGDIITWLIQRVVDLKEEVVSKTNDRGSA